MLTIEKIDENNWKFSGRFDASQADKATLELSRPTGTVTIDMSGLDYISSMGLSVLVNTYKQLNENGFKLRLTNINSHIRDIFKYTRLEQVFDIVDS